MSNSFLSKCRHKALPCIPVQCRKRLHFHFYCIERLTNIYRCSTTYNTNNKYQQCDSDSTEYWHQTASKRSYARQMTLNMCAKQATLLNHHYTNFIRQQTQVTKWNTLYKIWMTKYLQNIQVTSVHVHQGHWSRSRSVTAAKSTRMCSVCE